MMEAIKMERKNKINFSDKEKRQAAYLEKTYKKQAASDSEQETKPNSLSTVGKYKGGKK